MEQQGDLRLRTLITVIRRPNTSLKINAGRGDENILFCTHRLTTHHLSTNYPLTSFQRLAVPYLVSGGERLMPLPAGESQPFGRLSPFLYCTIACIDHSNSSSDATISISAVSQMVYSRRIAGSHDLGRDDWISRVHRGNGPQCYAGLRSDQAFRRNP